MDSNQLLTDLDLAFLPSFAKAFSCGCDTAQSNERVSIDVPFLQFLHDQPSDQLSKITIWNKTHRHMQIELEPLQHPNIFQAICEKGRNCGAYGGSQITLWVKCTPGVHKLAYDCLRIRVISKTMIGIRKRETMSVPLQLLPGYSWCSIPKSVSLPIVPVGQSYEVAVPLPRVPRDQGTQFFVTVRTSTPNFSNALYVSPITGILRNPDEDGKSGTSELLIRYTPKEYTTLVHTLQLHFPSIDINPLEITVYARSIPGLESRKIGLETLIMENLMVMAKRNKAIIENKKLPEPKFKFKPIWEKESFGTCFERNLGADDLTTPAGVMHFLLQQSSGDRERAAKYRQRKLRRIVKANKKASIKEEMEEEEEAAEVEEVQETAETSEIIKQENAQEILHPDGDHSPTNTPPQNQNKPGQRRTSKAGSKT